MFNVRSGLEKTRSIGTIIAISIIVLLGTYTIGPIVLYYSIVL